MVKSEIKSYYNNLAEKYDEDRFGNTYGNYIHKQEEKILNRYLKPPFNNIDLACGTGRFLKFAKSGLDLSPKMVSVSQQKHPDKTIQVGDIENLQNHGFTYQNATAFHLFMHLKPEQLDPIFKQVNSILEPNGLFIFDIPSKPRRKLLNFKAKGWHGTNSASKQDIIKALPKEWTLENYFGISFFPIHRIPKKWRASFIGLDNLLGRSFMKKYASHLIFVLKRKG